MKQFHRIILPSIVALFAMGAIAGCNSAANEQEDVKEAQQKLNEEKKDAAKED